MVERLGREVGRLEVSTAPEDAELWIDGTLRTHLAGKAVYYLNPAEHTVEVRKRDHEPFLRKLSLDPGEYRQVRAELRPGSTLLARCAVPHVRTRVDGKAWDDGAAQPLTAGKHEVQFVRSGYTTDLRRILVKPGAASLTSQRANLWQQSKCPTHPADPCYVATPVSP